MSNIKKKDKYKKSVNMSLRLTAEQKEKIDSEAKKNNMSVSDYVVKKATEKGGLRISRESERICRLVKIQEELNMLKDNIRATNSDEGVLKRINNLEKEFDELWLS